MSGQKHIIYRQVLDVEVPSVEGAWEIQNRVSDLYKYSLMQVISDVFDSIASPGEVLRIDKLEIDLGSLKAASLEEEITDKVKEILSERLAQMKLKAEGASSDDTKDENVSLRKRPARYTSIDFLVHFLRTGTTPWWHDREQFGTVQHVFEEQIRENPQWIRTNFPKLLREETVRKRIALGFEEMLVRKLIAVFKPEFSILAKQFLQLIFDERIGIRILNSQESQTQKGKTKTDESLNTIAGIQAPAIVRADFFEAILKSVQAGDAAILNTYFDTHEILLPAKKDAGLTREISQLASIAGLKLNTLVLDAEAEILTGKTPRKKRKQARRKRTKENLLDPYELISDADEIAEADQLIDPEEWIDADELSEANELVEENKLSAENKLIEADELITGSETEMKKDKTDETSSAAEKTGKKFQKKKKIRKRKAQRPGEELTDDLQPDAEINPDEEFEMTDADELQDTNETDEWTGTNGPDALEKSNDPDKLLKEKTADELTEENDPDLLAEETVEFEMIGGKKKNAETDASVIEEKEDEYAGFLPEAEDVSDFVIDNAGIILFWPYLTAFFDAVGLVKDRKFVNEAAASRAVHLLQYISDNGEFEYEEHDLVLNKILCGMDIDEPVNMHFEITETEKEEIDGLIQAVITNWKAIGTVSVHGLRITFIRKEGALKKTDQGWTLNIERKTVDMLLDKLPWSISIVRLPWSKDMLYVEW